MRKIKGFIKENYTIIFSFVLPLFLYFIILSFNINLKSKTIIYSDMFEQYAQFFNYLRETILNNKGLFNSFSFSLGQNFYGILTYFCISPLNIILLFSTNANMPYFLLILVLLKIALSSMTMAILLKQKYGNKPYIILFSTVYGLMAYNLTYYVNIMWLDCVYLLPLVILGFEKMLENKSSKLYILALTLSICTNYYIAFSVCLFLIIYFIYWIVINNEVKQFFKYFLKFIKYSIIAVLLSSIVLLPTVFNMLDGKFLNAGSSFSLTFSYNPLYLIYKFMIGDSKILLKDLPFISSSILILVLVILYAFNKKFSKRDRLITISTVASLIIITLVPALDTIMHCFRIPNQFTYRYAFIISFFLIINAYKCFINREFIDKKNVLLYLIIVFLIYYYLDLTIYFKTVLSALILLIYFISIMKLKSDKLFLIIAVPFILMELMINITTSHHEIYQTPYSEYSQLLKYQAKIENLKPKQNEFYRINGDNRVSYNDSFAHSYYGISSFSPTINLNANKFLKNYLGLPIDNSYAVDYISSTKFTDSLLGLKYAFLVTDDDFKIRENKANFPIIFAHNKNGKFEQGNSLIATENALYRYLGGTDEDIFTKYSDFEIIDCRLEGNNLISLNKNYCDIKVDGEPNYVYYVEIKTRENYLVPIYDFVSTTEQYGNNFILDITDEGTLYIGKDIVSLEYLDVYKLDLAKLEQLSETLNAKALNIEKHNNNEVKGKINNEQTDQIMFTTIPYDRGWHVKINDKEIKTFKNLDSLLAFELPEGELDIKIYFVPQGFKTGFLISIITAIIIIRNCLKESRCFMIKKIKNYLKLIRLKHYVKNLIILAPAFFAHKLDISLLLKYGSAFFAFSFLASSVYVINDIKDVSKDRIHATKKNRPIASGEITVSNGIIISIIMFFLAFLLNYLTTSSLVSYIVLGLYFILNIAYTFKIKHVPIFDLFLLVSFYVLRLYYGGVIASVRISNWLLLTVISAAFFLAFGKRRNEFIKTSDKTRSVLKYYNKSFLDKFMYLSLGLTLVFYSIWVVEQNIKFLIFSIPFLFLIFLRYSLILEGESDGDPTEVLFKDKELMVLCILYIAFIATIIGVFYEHI